MSLKAKTLPSFDPQMVPVVGVDSHLQAVEAAALTPQALRQRFQRQPEWSPELRAEHQFSERVPSHASVLIPVMMRAEPTVLLTQRTAHLSSHSGQIAFPGGKADASDADAIATALREAHEEVGLEPQFAEVLGTLPHYTTGSAFIVTPVIALISPEARLCANPDEVAHVFEVPLAFLMDPANHRRHQVEWDGATREWFSMPFRDSQAEWFIWGATAGMLRNLYRFLRA